MTDTASTQVAGSSETDVRALVREIVLELAPKQDFEAIEGDVLLIEHLEYHSLALLEMAFTLEDEFELSAIDEETARDITTLGDIENHFVNELRGRGDIAA